LIKITAREAMILVHELTARTLGGLIGRSETIMHIVPRADELVVEAKVAPQDIDQVASGAEAVMHIMAGNQRTTPMITGSVTRVSADITPEQQNSNQPAQAYYPVRIALPADELVLPGMPVQVFIQTHERTPVLLKPLREQTARTFRER
jgi:HlyD family secretion protein